MVQMLEALSAEGVTAVDQNPRNLITNIEVVSAMVTKVKTSCFIVTLDLNDRLPLQSFQGQFFLFSLSFVL